MPIEPRVDPGRARAHGRRQGLDSFLHRVRPSPWLIPVAQGILLLIATGCAATVSSRPTYTVRVVDDTVSLVERPDWKGFRIAAIVRNQGPTELYAHWCHAQAQREIDAQWTTVWSEACGSDLTWPTTLAAGDSLMREFFVGGSTRAGYGTPLDARIVSGRYRIEFFLSVAVNGPYMIDAPPLAQRVTNAFVVREP